MTLDEHSLLLWCIQGVRNVTRGNKATSKNVPSAGARHAIDTYILINNVDSLEKGLYRYIALEHSIIDIRLEDSVSQEIVAACLGQGFVAMGTATFILEIQ